MQSTRRSTAKRNTPVSIAACVLVLAACAGRPQRAVQAPTASTARDTPRLDNRAAQTDAAHSVDASAQTPRPMPHESALCRTAAGRFAESLHRTAVPTEPEPACPENNPMCDTVDRAPTGASACFVSNSNIDRTEARANAQPTGRTTGTPRRATAWDHRTDPQWFDRVNSHLHFTPQERTTLTRNGFVALGRESFDSYALAYHEIFRQQLPVFVSVDSILHAIFQSHGSLLQNIEVHSLAPKLGRILSRMRATLRGSRGMLSANLQGDLDIYLTVATALSKEEPREVRALFHNDDGVQEILNHVQGESLESVELFGRTRMVDFSQFTPRGHYSESLMGNGGEISSLGPYFRAMMWLSRLEFNLVSRSCRSSQPGESVDPSETPREAVVALALAELAERAGVMSEIQEFERVYQVFAGNREDVSLQDLLRLEQNGHFQSRDPSAFAQLKASIGASFQRTSRVHYMPDGATVLPAIATMFGARIVPDVGALERVVHQSIAGRTHLGFADVGYALGHNRAQAYLTADLQQYPTLRPALDGARGAITQGVEGGGDLYRHWLRAIVSLSHASSGVEPTFMATEAWQDFRLNSALVGYGQIRHNYVLLAGQGYDSYGCEIPDGYVEPAVEVYDALLEFVRVARTLSPTQASYFRRVAAVLQTLRAIALTERSGAVLSDAQKRWLGMVAEYIPAGGFAGMSGQPPKWTGWYFDLFADREIGAEKAADFVADYFTLTNTSTVMYLGAETPRMGAFVVDTNGPARMMVGPVARGYETSTPIGTRLDDEAARTSSDHRAAWRGSYMVETSVPELETAMAECGEGELRMALRSALQAGVAEVELLDHHGEPLSQRSTVTLSEHPTYVSFEATSPNAPEYVHIAVRSSGGATFDYSVRWQGQSRGAHLFGPTPENEN